MSSTLNNESEFFDLQFTKQVKSVSQAGELILAYDGVLNNDTISKLEVDLEDKFADKKFSKPLIKKIFFICVESLQNQLIHGCKDSNGAQHNFFLLGNTGLEIIIISANLIPIDSIDRVKTQIEKINSFNNPFDLKQFYLEHLENNDLSAKGGAGLGFITMAMKSGNKLLYTIDPINDKNALFLLEIKINLGQAVI